MSAPEKNPHQSIPEWVFVVGLCIGVLASGLLLVNRQIRKSVHPVISEINTLNRAGLTDADGDHSDWIEIWNPTENPINLEGYSLSDNFRDLRRWRFPNRTLEPGGFLIVFASGKNRSTESGELHTSFRLDPEGEYLVLVAPDGQQRVHEMLPKYPRQFADTTFGIRPELFQTTDLQIARTVDDMSFLLEPTPGKANQNEMLGLVQNVSFTKQRGFYFGTNTVALTTETHGAEIRFTLDGSLPNSTNGVPYTEPIRITDTTLLRAVASRPGFRSSPVGSHTYLFPRRAVLALSPEIEPERFERVVNGFSDVPTISLMVPNTDVWSAYDPGQPLQASLEFIEPNKGAARHVDCGVRISSLGPPNFGPQIKSSFRISINDRYGDSEWKYPLFGRTKPRSFRELVLLGGSVEHAIESLVTDAWMRATMSNLGQRTARSRFVHLFLNGDYRGLYNLAEAPESAFATLEQNGVPEFDVRVSGRQIFGDSIAWNAMTSSVNATGEGIRPLDRVAAMLDVKGFANLAVVDSFANAGLLTSNGGWMAVRARGESSPFQILMTFAKSPVAFDQSASPLRQSSPPTPASLFAALMRNDTFHELYTERATELISEGGILSEEEALDRFEFISKQIANAMHTDALRWGNESPDLSRIRTWMQERPAEFAGRVREQSRSK